MKTLKRITLAMALMSLIFSQAYSQKVPANKTEKDARASQTMNAPAPGKFVDNNHDGVCDNYQSRIKNGHSANFVDKNGDGICDNRPNAGEGRGNPNGCGMGNQHRHGHGQGNCCRGGNGYQHRHGQGNQNSPATGSQKPNTKN